MPRCLSQVMKVSLLAGAALLSVGWALSESRSVRRLTAFAPRPPDPPSVAADAPPDPPRQARLTPVLPPHPLPPPLPARPAPPPRPSVAHLAGRIVDEHGRPLPGAKIDLDNGDVCIWIFVRDDGSFEADLPPGAYTVVARGNGDHDESRETALNLDPGEEVRDLVLELPAPAPVEEETGIHIEQPTWDD
jgi:Carboxypeptidase regulatory-like domain